MEVHVSLIAVNSIARAYMRRLIGGLRGGLSSGWDGCWIVFIPGKTKRPHRRPAISLTQVVQVPGFTKGTKTKVYKFAPNVPAVRVVVNRARWIRAFQHLGIYRG